MFNYSLKIENHINNCLYEHYKELIKKVPQERVLGIFAIGSMNYGLYQEGISDVDTKAIIIPSWDEILNNNYVNNTISHFTLDSGICSIKDIRSFIKELNKSNMNSYELLFTPFCYINPTYQKYWDQIANSKTREQIVYNDIKTLLSTNIATIKGHLNSKKLTPKRYSHAVRLIYASKKIIDTIPFSNCLWQEDIKEELIKIKQSDISENNADLFTHVYDGTIELINSYINLLPKDSYDNSIKNMLINWEKEIIFNQLRGENL